MAVSTSRALNVALWIAQFILAAVFVTAGLMKVRTPIATLAMAISWAARMPWLVRFIGVAELAGAAGLVLPAVSRIKPGLISLAALGLLVVMILATGYHVMRGELGALRITLSIGALAAFVAWGRSRKLPITPRQR